MHGGKKTMISQLFLMNKYNISSTPFHKTLILSKAQFKISIIGYSSE